MLDCIKKGINSENSKKWNNDYLSEDTGFWNILLGISDISLKINIYFSGIWKLSTVVI